LIKRRRKKYTLKRTSALAIPALRGLTNFGFGGSPGAIARELHF